MDQARVILAIVLSFLVFFLWNYFTTDKDAVQKAREETQLTQVETQKKLSPEEKSNAGSTANEFLKKTEAGEGTGRTIRIDTELYTAEISENGAVLKSLMLKKYRETNDKESPLKELISKDVINGVCRTWFKNQTIPEMKKAVYNADTGDEKIKVISEMRIVKFVWVSSDGVTIEKEYSFSPDSYLIGLNLTIKNGLDRPLVDHLILSIEKKFSEEGRVYGFTGPSALINNKLEQIKTKKLKDKDTFEGSVNWIALQDRYFLESVIPENKDDAKLRVVQLEEGLLESRLITEMKNINPGEVKRFAFNLYFGPKSMKILKDLNNGLGKAINFGMFDILAKPCLWIMNFVYGFIPNYGIAIIILTIFTKILLWPLGNKSYKSMGEMKKIQPLMAELREKYKDDKKRMNQELMSLYKVYKINPMGGCLPMVVQMPVFFALYRMLYEAIELRHAPFFMWINDLSAPDRLFSFDFSIPFMEPPYGIPVLTIVMGATMFLQQKLTPAPGDPTQAKMMMFMPIIFTVIFINFSSGLVLYWLINNILSIAQQHYTQKKLA
ncbi:MAG: membrane protein insertase YidC [Deltaproteobacteria bacterium]|nr:membrane protein insertase YidC [Deltaproteobacteria bacterium]